MNDPHRRSGKPSKNSLDDEAEAERRANAKDGGVEARIRLAQFLIRRGEADASGRGSEKFAETARLFAALNAALMDAGIACWDAKYHYNFWRPVTAIPRAGEDGNGATAPDKKWLPLLNTPAHPEYPSGHSTFSGAGLAVLAGFLGTEEVAIEVRSDGLPNTTRKFASLCDCAVECGMSRVYAGIHYRFSCEDGQKVGEAVGKEVLIRFPVKP